MPDLETSLDLCTYCPRLCSHTCPVSITSGRETLVPQAKMARFGVLSRADPATTSTAWIGTEPFYGCTGCGACTDACLHHVEPAIALIQARTAAERAESGHPALSDLPARHRRRAELAAASLTAADLAPRAAAPNEAAFLPSCLPRGAAASGPADEARAALRVCDRLPEGSARLGIVDAPLACAGYPLYAGGFAEPFRLHAESFARSIEKYSTVVLSCSACTWLLRSQYKEHGVPLRPEIKHISEWLVPHVDNLPVARRLPVATYSDPCHLGRRLDCYEPPRQILRRCVEDLRELPDHHQAARCCGSGGLLPTTAPELARAIAVERLAEHSQQGGPLVSACPACAHHLSRSGEPSAEAADASKPESNTQGTVRTLIEILDEATTNS